MKDMLVKRLVKIPVYHSPKGGNGHYAPAGWTLAGLDCGCSAPGTLGCGCMKLSGFGNGAQVQSAASYAAMGAKAGSIVPGVGNIIGGAIGAVAGAILGKKKPVRPSAEQMSQCNQVMNEYESAIAQFGPKPIGMALGEGNLKSVFICFEMVRAGTTKDPRFLDGNWQLARDAAIEAVKKVFSAPPGTQVTLSTAGRKDIKGKAFRPASVTWTNTETNTLDLVAQKVWQFFNAGCLAYNKASVCSGIQDTALYRKMVLDLVDWAAGTYIPQVQVPRDPAAVAAEQAATAPPAPPPVAIPTPVAPVPVTAPLAPVQPLPPPIAPFAPGAPTPTVPVDQTGNLIASLLQQGATAQETFTAALRSLQSQGVQATPQVQADVASLVKSGGKDNTNLIVAGVAGAGLIAVALIVMKKKGRR
jgi:hypothetical protein